MKFLFDGEEEVGSPNIGRLIQEHPDFVEADICVWESGFIDQEGRPSVSFGLKGLVYLELRCQNLPSDIHSAWATVIENPAWRLTHALASLRDNQGRITIDGLMDHVVAPSKEERRLLETMEMDLETYKELYGVKEFLAGEKGESTQQRLLFSPPATSAASMRATPTPRARPSSPTRHGPTWTSAWCPILIRKCL